MVCIYLLGCVALLNGREGCLCNQCVLWIHSSCCFTGRKFTCLLSPCYKSLHLNVVAFFTFSNELSIYLSLRDVSRNPLRSWESWRSPWGPIILGEFHSCSPVRRKSLCCSNHGRIYLTNCENLKEYYYAAQLQHLVYWCDTSYTTKCKDIELKTEGCHVQSKIANRNNHKSQRLFWERDKKQISLVKQTEWL